MADILGGWENFYVIMGSSAAALTGLQFVVIALVHDSDMRSGGGEVGAFATPTVVHFCMVLFLSGVITAPWPSLLGPGFAIALCGLAGAIYSLVVTNRARKTTVYTPVLEDWIWHSVLPLIAYLAILFAGTGIHAGHAYSPFVIAASTLLLLYIGIHNAWDTVTYIATWSREHRSGNAPETPPPPPTS
jgi:hypothetical protein